MIVSTCALDLNASTAESLDRMRRTSVSSAPICKPQPMPKGVRTAYVTAISISQIRKWIGEWNTSRTE